MNEEIDETEFYHQDFTTASEWEVFIARIEEVLNQWKKDEQQNKETNDIWSTQSENITFVDFEFQLVHLRKNQPKTSENGDAKKHVFDSLHDFELYDPKNVTPHHKLSQWYGLDHYIVLAPAGKQGITSESKIKMLLSSVYIVSSNMDLEIPIFVQIREIWQQCYLGVYHFDNIRTNLEMVHLRTAPSLCQYLSGLLELFKSKIVSSTMNTTILVSLQSSYTLTEFGNFAWKQDYLSPESGTFDGNDLYSLPFGVTIDPIEAITLKATWSQLNHRACRDSEAGTDFEPTEAHKWSLLVSTTDQPVSLLGECLTEYLHLLNNASTTYDILGEYAAAPQIDNNPLDLLTEPKVPTISTLLSRAARNSLTSRSRKATAPLTEDILVPMLYFLFPDASADGLQYKEPANRAEDAGLNLEHECRGFKTCNSDSLVWRLSIVMSHALQSLGGVRAFAHLWYEFVQEMRYRWEKCISIPGLHSGYPDLRTCLLHQKLQMLNCCIERKRLRENSATSFDSAEDDHSSDEEFYDCDGTGDETKTKKQKYSLWNQPVGRLGKFENFKLIQTGDAMYIPVTQEPVPKTEDQLQEDTDVLLQLGSDAQGSEMRAKMMSASLLSDMESFKAANPGSILEDFIRWYSPRDWIESDDGELDEWGQKKGTLSGRMLIEDNFWMQTWQSAKPVPATRQKRLFDDTREAEKVLHYLDSRTLAQIAEVLSPTLAHAAIYRLSEETAEMQETADCVRGLIRIGERLSRDSSLPLRRFEGFIQEVTALELKMSQVNSLMYKFNPAGCADERLAGAVAHLVEGREIEVGRESAIAARLLAMFSEAQKTEEMEVVSKGPLPAVANEREIVLRVAVPRPATYSAECPQFLRAVLSKNGFRLAGAFSEDIVFF